MPTEKQKLVIGAIANHTDFWMGCGDIDSPSHYIDIEDTRNLLMEGPGISKHDAELFAIKMVDLLNYLRSLQ